MDCACDRAVWGRGIDSSARALYGARARCATITAMNSESLRIADQLHRAFEGDAWHGPCLRELLSGVTAKQAWTHPLPQGHSIWELVLHIDIYVRAAAEA